MIGDVNPEVDGYLPYSEWLAYLTGAQAVMDEARLALSTSVDFDDYATHTWSERLVGGFLRPTPARIASERGWSIDEVEAWIAAEGLVLEEDPEYPDLGPVLARAEVDDLLGAPTPVLASERETLEALAPRPPWTSCGPR